MRDYRAYFIGPDGSITGRVDLVCADDDDARERAKQLVSSQPVERLIERFEPPGTV
jgi:hypothetical protein